MIDEEFKAASTYVLLNCEEVVPFVAEFDKQMRILYPQVSHAQLDGLREERFSCWLREHNLHFQEDHIPSNQQPIQITSEFDQPNLVRADVGAEELDGAEFRMSNIDSEMLDVEENAEHDYVDSSDGFTTSASEGENSLEYNGLPVSYELPRVEPLDMNSDGIPTAEPLSESRRSVACHAAPIIEPIPLPVSRIASVTSPPNQSLRISGSSESVVFVFQNPESSSRSPSASPGSVHN
ncbi:Uncharacterized protein Fot_22168 [Forsythia ovata]|uniref:Uncharacterized protein n=1 Tax=Forsythia ovata TaxID=205694 RepID=A0ABD1UX76_9LAMI